MVLIAIEEPSECQMAAFFLGDLNFPKPFKYRASITSFTSPDILFACAGEIVELKANKAGTCVGLYTCIWSIYLMLLAPSTLPVFPIILSTRTLF